MLKTIQKHWGTSDLMLIKFNANKKIICVFEQSQRGVEERCRRQKVAWELWN